MPLWAWNMALVTNSAMVKWSPLRSTIMQSLILITSIHFSSVQSLYRLGSQEDMTDDSASFSSLFCSRQLWVVLARAGMSALWCCPSSISSSNHSTAHHSPRYPEGRFWRCSSGAWHTKTMQVPISSRLPEEDSFHKEVDFALHPAVGLMLQVGDMEKFLQVLDFKSLDPFYQNQQAGFIFHGHRGWWRLTRNLYNLNLLVKLMLLLYQILFNLTIAATAEAIMMQISAMQVPSLPQGTWNWSPPLLAAHANFCTDVVRAVDQDLVLFCANFHCICSCSV